MVFISKRTLSIFEEADKARLGLERGAAAPLGPPQGRRCGGIGPGLPPPGPMTPGTPWAYGVPRTVIALDSSFVTPSAVAVAVTRKVPF